jgi:hypothetical protein
MHVLLSYVFGSLPVIASAFIFTVLVWYRRTVSAFATSIVRATSFVAYCVVGVAFRGELMRVMSVEFALSLTCLAVATALILHVILRWARYI